MSPPDSKKVAAYVWRLCRIRHRRHSYRSWLDAVGTPMAVQQKLMRHASITTTMNIYGDVVTDEMAEAHSKVVHLALSKQ
jgi:integrase